jgi:RNA polymerase sigma-70 factor (ECF subfamily)
VAEESGDRAADRALVDAIVAGDRSALSRLVAREHAWLVRLARAIVRDEAVADEIVQDGWVAVIRALGAFEGRSSLRTWIATIVLNRAKTAAVRGARTVAVADLGADPADDEDAPDPSRFSGVGLWSKPPEPWENVTPEVLLQRRQVLDAVDAAMAELPANQRAVLALRDVEGWSGEEVCNALGLSESNQRVLLHRARAKVREALEHLLGPESSS